MLLISLCATEAALAVRVVTYNILNFPGSTGPEREDDFRIVMQEIDPDVLVVQEILSQYGVDEFLDDVLNHESPGEYAAGPFVNGPDTDNALFYRASAITFVSAHQVHTALRDISEYVVRPVGYSSADAELRIYSLHLKAGSSVLDQAKRLAEATILREYFNDLPSGSHFMIAGDLNIRGSSEDAYQKLVGDEPDNDGRVVDPVDRPGYWHENHVFEDIHTQSTRTTAFGGGATGGLDDRFDQILISYALGDEDDLSYVQGTHVAYGNDGNHLNQAINYGTNTAVGSVIADALHEASDHLPVYADFQVPARIDAPAEIEFGNVIVGFTAMLPLTVGNVAVAPADELLYSFGTLEGFVAPQGSFELGVGEEADHDISMDTQSVGHRSAALGIRSNDVDNPEWMVFLSGTTLDHARPSLSGDVETLLDTLDFGSHPIGGFGEETASVFNFDYSELQALLEIYAADIEGADGRFDFAGGFAPLETGADPACYTLAFDDSGAAADSLYTAVLTFHTRDDTAVSGGCDLDDLVVHLCAYVETGGTGVPEEEHDGFLLAVASSNPFNQSVVLKLYLPEPAVVVVRVHDIAGRLVRTFRTGRGSAGRLRVSWDGTDEGGRECASGIYFCRAEAGGWSAVRTIALLR